MKVEYGFLGQLHRVLTSPLPAMWRPLPLSWVVFAASTQSRLALSLSSFSTDLAPYKFDIKIQLPVISRLLHNLFVY